MGKKTLLVLGASGLTGYKIMQQAGKKFEVLGTYNARIPLDKGMIRLDLKNEDGIRHLISGIKPDVLINTTALHNVDYCEQHPDESYYINTKVVGTLSQECNRIGARLVHISTDFVFDGLKDSYVESDEAVPLSTYGRHKLEGEALAKTCSSWAILRPSVVYGWTPLETQGSTSSSGKPMNFALWALQKMNKNEELKIVDDQFSSPTLADTLAAVALRLADRTVNELYHVSGTSCLSRYEFTKKIAEMMGYPVDLVKPISSKSFVQAAKRPAKSCLDCTKVQKELNYRLLGVDESLAVMRSQIALEAPDLIGA